MEGGEGHRWSLQLCFTVRWRVLRSAALQFPYQTVMQPGQHALNGTPVEGGEDGGGRLALFSRRRESVGAVVPFFYSDVVLVRWGPPWCAPPGIWLLLTLSTVELSMVSGGWSPEFHPKVHHNLLCLTHIKGQAVCPTPFSQLGHFLSVVRFHSLSADETYHWCVIG